MDKLPFITLSTWAAVAVAAVLFLPSAFAETPGTDLLAQGDRPGMMGGGMMGRFMNDQSATISVNPKHAKALLAYIRNHNLSCSQCHSISGSGVGPSFAMISAAYANHADAAAILKDHIANGFGRMPGGLASDSESANLAKMILDLAKYK